jgi:hypothetical protein
MVKSLVMLALILSVGGAVYAQTVATGVPAKFLIGYDRHVKSFCMTTSAQQVCFTGITSSGDWRQGTLTIAPVLSIGTATLSIQSR